MTEPVIRNASDQDIELLSDVIRRSYADVARRFGLTAANCPKHPSNCTVEWIRRDLARNLRYFILDVGGEAVGCAALEKVDDSLCYLERLCVLPQHRRKGYGRILAAHVLAQAGAGGAARVGIGIIADQVELKQWYQAIGFVEGESRHFAHLPFRVTFLTYSFEACAV